MHIPVTMKKYLPVIVVLLAGIALNQYFARSPQAFDTSGIMVLEEPVEAPDFTLTDLNGTPYRLSELRGNVVLLNFWTTW